MKIWLQTMSDGVWQKNISQNKEALIRHLDAIQIFIQYLKMQVTEGDFNIDYAENLLGDLNNIVNIKKSRVI